MSTVTPGGGGGEIARSPLDRATSAAHALMAYWWYRWDWGEAAGFDGLASLSAAARWSPGRAYVLDELRDELGRHAANQAVSIHAPCRCMLRFASDLGTEAVNRYVDDVAREIAAGAASQGARQLFVDSLYADPALLVEVGLARADQELAVSGVALALTHLRALQDERSSLLHHFVDQSTGASARIDWARGNGWGVTGLANLLRVLPDALDGRSELIERFRRLADALVEQQDVSGAWRNLISSPTSFPEASATALIVVALTDGVALGLLGAEHAAAAKRGWVAIQHRIDANGHLVGVSARPGLHLDPARYEHGAVGGVYPWGNGPYLLALAQRLGDELTP